MDKIFIATVYDDQEKLECYIESCMDNSESLYDLKECFIKFKEKYPDKWKDIKESIGNKILGYFEIF